MRRVFTLIAALAVFLPLSACAPWPHIEHHRPSMTGRLMEAGQPVAGAELFLGAQPGSNQPCREVGERLGVSGLDGRFGVAALSRTVLMHSWIQSPEQTGQLTALCIRRPPQDVQIGALVWMFIDKPLSVTLECELSRARGRQDLGNAQVSSPLGQPQFCHAARVPAQAS
ncbi:hypothetical protein [Inhella inkyongensis]|nr:hypothetical protein [Inhella inkyongensis]